MTSTSSNFTSPSLPLKRLGPVRENGSFYYTKARPRRRGGPFWSPNPG